MNLDRRISLVGWMLAICFACATCTFPSVEYDSSCVAPTLCAKELSACTNKAEAAQNMCAMKCSMSCSECDNAFDQALTGCLTQCESCSASAGCMDATESCKALLGVP